MWAYKWSKRNNYGKQDQLRIHPEEGVRCDRVAPAPFYKLLECFSTLFEALPFSVKVIGFWGMAL